MMNLSTTNEVPIVEALVGQGWAKSANQHTDHVVGDPGFLFAREFDDGRLVKLSIEDTRR
jgi:hypothetical protein